MLCLVDEGIQEVLHSGLVSRFFLASVSGLRFFSSSLETSSTVVDGHHWLKLTVALSAPLIGFASFGENVLKRRAVRNWATSMDRSTLGIGIGPDHRPFALSWLGNN